LQIEPEQVELLRELADRARGANRDNRLFMMLGSLSVTTLMGPGGQRDISPSEEHDIHDLAHEGLLRIRNQNLSGDLHFTVAPEAYTFLAEHASKEPLVQVEETVIRRYIDGAAFKGRYPVAYARWSEAAALLWGPEPDRELTTIGHKTREAVQEFATALIEHANLKEVDSDRAHTASRLRAVIDNHRDRLGEARRELLDALVVYWGEANDLLQRQEHGGQKEGLPLDWEDGRRAVFQTAIVMYEIDRMLAAG
jgi:hypothetical protein